MPTKVKEPSRIEINRDSDRYIATIVKGESITIEGFKKVGSTTAEITGRNTVEKLYLEAIKSGGDAWLVLADCWEGTGYFAAKYCRELCEKMCNGTATVSEADTLRRHVQSSRPKYRQIHPVTFKIGEQAEYGSYNLSYYGEIKSITEKTVTICSKGTGGRTKRLKIEQFCWRNHDFTLAKAQKRNSEWSD